MADETEVKAEETEVKEETQQTQDTQVEVEEPQTGVHPLEPGGKRFSEVYGEMKDARREAADLRERLARVEGQISVTQPQPRPAATYTNEQLQAAVDAGKITPAQMAAQISWQYTEAMRQRVNQEAETRQRNQSALSEISQYVDKLPELLNSSSKEFSKVASVAREIAAEIGRTVDDPIVQRRALREAFGSLDKVTQVRAAGNASRGMGNMDTETRGAGGITGTGKADPFKDVPQHYKDHWNRLNYTQEQKLAELKYIKPRRTAR